MFEGKPIAEDAGRIFEVARTGGVAIFPVSVGCQIVHDRFDIDLKGIMAANS